MDDRIERINDIGHGSQQPTWYRFLQKAFLPSVSDNSSGDRFDQAMAQVTHLAVASRRILDVGAGDCLFLKALLDKHDCQGGDGPDDRIEYVAIDSSPEAHENFMGLAKQAAGLACCFDQPKFVQANATAPELLQVALRGEPFDLILLNNVLHELEPNAVFPLFAALASALSEAGRIVIVDPDADWALSEAAFQEVWQHCEWEVDAVWYRKEHVEELARHVGLNPKSSVFKRQRMTLWEVTCSGSGAVEPERAPFLQLLIKHQQTQVSRDLKRYNELRDELRKLLRNRSEGASKEVLKKAVQFATTSATCCRRLSVIEGLKA